MRFKKYISLICNYIYLTSGKSGHADFCEVSVHKISDETFKVYTSDGYNILSEKTINSLKNAKNYAINKIILHNAKLNKTK